MKQKFFELRLNTNGQKLYNFTEKKTEYGTCKTIQILVNFSL